MSFQVRLLPVCFLALSCAACASGRGDLGGTVSYNDKKLTSGSVQVVGSDNIVRGGGIEADGTYLVKDILAGEVRICVNSPDPGQAKVNLRKKDEAPPPPKDRSGWFRIPPHYGDFDQSGLKFPLRSGANTFDIVLNEAGR